MKLRQAVLRLFSPASEQQRQEFRMTLACASAHAEDLNRTACFLVEDLQCTGKQLLPAKGVKPT